MTWFGVGLGWSGLSLPVWQLASKNPATAVDADQRTWRRNLLDSARMSTRMGLTMSTARVISAYLRFALFAVTASAVIASGMWIVSGSRASADHYEHSGEMGHFRGMHGSGALDWCAQSLTTQITSSASLDRIDQVLRLTNPDWDWHNSGGGLVDFLSQGTCGSFNPIDPATTSLNAAYKVEDSLTAKCGASNNIGCVRSSFYTCSAQVPGDCHRKFGKVWLRTDYFQETNNPGGYTSLINHETGHLLGLCDGGDCGGGGSTQSIMHNLFAYTWPTLLGTSPNFYGDHGSVRDIAWRDPYIY